MVTVRFELTPPQRYACSPPGSPGVLYTSTNYYLSSLRAAHFERILEAAQPHGCGPRTCTQPRHHGQRWRLPLLLRCCSNRFRATVQVLGSRHSSRHLAAFRCCGHCSSCCSRKLKEMLAVSSDDRGGDPRAAPYALSVLLSHSRESHRRSQPHDTSSGIPCNAAATPHHHSRLALAPSWRMRRWSWHSQKRCCCSSTSTRPLPGSGHTRCASCCAHHSGSS